MGSPFNFSKWFGKDKNAKESKGRNSEQLNNELLEAAQNNDVPRVKELLDAGADVNCQTQDGWTPLLKAAVHYVELTKILIEHGADPNIASNKGYTPLHRAAGHGNSTVVLALLDAEADVLAKDDFGQTPHKIALHEGRDEMADMLEFRMHLEASEAGKHRIFLEGKYRAVFTFAPPSNTDYHFVNATFTDGTVLNNAKVYHLSDLEIPADYVGKKLNALRILLDQP